MIVTETEYRIPESAELVSGFKYEKYTAQDGWIEQVQEGDPNTDQVALFITLLEVDRIRVAYQVTREVEPPKPSIFTQFTTWISETPFFAKYVTPVLAVAAPVVLLVVSLIGLLFLGLLPGGLLVQQVFRYFLLALTGVTLARIGSRILTYAFDKFSFGAETDTVKRDYTLPLLIAMGVLFLVANLTKV